MRRTNVVRQIREVGASLGKERYSATPHNERLTAKMARTFARSSGSETETPCMSAELHQSCMRDRFGEISATTERETEIA